MLLQMLSAHTIPILRHCDPCVPSNLLHMNVVYVTSLKVELGYFWWLLSAKTYLKTVSFLLSVSQHTITKLIVSRIRNVITMAIENTV